MTNSNTPSDAGGLAELAGRLTDAQRDALLNPEWHGSGETQSALVECLVGLAGPLAHMFTLRWDRLTPLGHDVRRHLLASEQVQQIGETE